MSWSFRPCTAQGGRSDGPIQQIDARSSRPGPDHALCLSGPGSTRHAEPTHPQSSPVRDLWLFGGIWNDLCRRAGLDRDAQTSIKRRHEPKHGDNHGRSSPFVGNWQLHLEFAAAKGALVANCRRRSGKNSAIQVAWVKVSGRANARPDALHFQKTDHAWSL